MKAAAKRGLIIAGIAGAIAIVALSTALRRPGNSNDLRVDYVRATRRALEEKISGTGTFLAEKSVTVYARTAGTVRRVLVEPGQKVKEGQAILEIDREDALRSLQRAEASLEVARAAARQNILRLRTSYQSAALGYGEARADLARNEELFKSRAIAEEALRRSRNTFASAEISLQSARQQLNLATGRPLDAEPDLASDDDEALVEGAAEVAQAKLSVDEARMSLEACLPRALLAGTVTQMTAQPGDLLSLNAPLARIETLDAIVAEVLIDEVDIGKIKLGDPVEITSDSLLGQSLTGKVSALSPIVERIGTTRMSKVRISVDREALGIRPGASCTARIVAQSKESALVVPLVALLNRENRSFVYVVSAFALESNPGGSAPHASGSTSGAYVLKETEITVGIGTIDYVEVTSGLAEGDRVAVGNLSLYRDGVRVGLGQER